ncbi:hypothetical protein IPF89_04180 [Candidatus Saccharibacteria bacterium]|nr:MAG: hypothetical protein IPF89_04180 [Candidatus Saccharibacteria bacterium]
MYGEGESLADFGNYTMHSVLGDLSNISVTDKPPTPQKDAYNEFVKKLSEKQHQLFDSYNASKFNMKFSIIDDLGGKKLKRRRLIRLALPVPYVHSKSHWGS